MLLMRCAWHPKYRGYPWVYRVASWRGSGIDFSDGMCRSCARRWRAEFHAGRVRVGDVPPSLPRLVPAWMPRVGLALALSIALIFAARPLDPAAMRHLAGARGAPRSGTVAQALPASVAHARSSPRTAARLEPAAAQIAGPACPVSAPSRSRPLTPNATIRRVAPAPARATVVSPPCVRPAGPRVIPLSSSDCRAIAVSAPTAPLVFAQAP